LDAGANILFGPILKGTFFVGPLFPMMSFFYTVSWNKIYDVLQRIGILKVPKALYLAPQIIAIDVCPHRNNKRGMSYDGFLKADNTQDLSFVERMVRASFDFIEGEDDSYEGVRSKDVLEQLKLWNVPQPAGTVQELFGEDPDSTIPYEDYRDKLEAIWTTVDIPGNIFSPTIDEELSSIAPEVRKIGRMLSSCTCPPSERDDYQNKVLSRCVLYIGGFFNILLYGSLFVVEQDVATMFANMFNTFGVSLLIASGVMSLFVAVKGKVMGKTTQIFTGLMAIIRLGVSCAGIWNFVQVFEQLDYSSFTGIFITSFWIYEILMFVPTLFVFIRTFAYPKEVMREIEMEEGNVEGSVEEKSED
jgi:hypothetical protein